MTTEGHADVEPFSKRTRPAPAHDGRVNPPYVPPPTSSPHTPLAPTAPTKPHTARPAFPSLARLPVAADVNPPPPSPVSQAASRQDDGWQHKALWLERRAQAEQQRAGGVGGPGIAKAVAAAAVAADDAMDVTEGVTTSVVGPGSVSVEPSRGGNPWVPLPPRQRGGRRRPRGLSVEMSGVGGVGSGGDGGDIS